MPFEPDPRWRYICGHVTSTGVHPVSPPILENLAQEWTSIVADIEEFGGTELLAAARSLVVLSWFDYDQLVTASLKAFQAVEATFRQVLYPDARERVSFRSLVKRAASDGVLTADRAEVILAGVEMRNHLSHPAGSITFTLGIADQMLRVAHLVVRDICALRGMVRTAPPAAL